MLVVPRREELIRDRDPALYPLRGTASDRLEAERVMQAPPELPPRRRWSPRAGAIVARSPRRLPAWRRAVAGTARAGMSPAAAAAPAGASPAVVIVVVAPTGTALRRPPAWTGTGAMPPSGARTGWRAGGSRPFRMWSPTAGVTHLPSAFGGGEDFRSRKTCLWTQWEAMAPTPAATAELTMTGISPPASMGVSFD